MSHSTSDPRFSKQKAENQRCQKAANTATWKGEVAEKGLKKISRNPTGGSTQ